MIPNYDNWKTANPFDEIEEMAECGNCRKEFSSNELIYNGHIDVCKDCFKTIEDLQNKVNTLLKPVVELKRKYLQVKLNTKDVKYFLPEIQALRWIKKELEHYGIQKEKVRIHELNQSELEYTIEILKSLYKTNDNLKCQTCGVL